MASKRTTTAATSPASAPRAAVATQAAARSTAPPLDGSSREDMIRLSAYRFFEQRGCVYGHEIEDWLKAEAEVDRALAATPHPADAH